MNRKLLYIIAIVVIAAATLWLTGLISLGDTASDLEGYVVSKVSARVTRAHAAPTVDIPSHAVERAPGVFYLGQAISEGRAVEGYMIIDYRKAYGKPGGACGDGICQSSENVKRCPQDCNASEPAAEPQCYAYLSKDTAWKRYEGYTLNPANMDGLEDSYVQSAMSAALDAWDTEVSSAIFGPAQLTADTLVADEVAPDGKNEVYFGSIGGDGTIALTIVWGIFSGPPKQRELMEWDMVFDDLEFEFGDAGPLSETELGDTSVMDLLNIATHEAGHAAGMAHPDDLCLDETMYRFAEYGETKKRTLHSGDISGIKALY